MARFLQRIQRANRWKSTAKGYKPVGVEPYGLTAEELSSSKQQRQPKKEHPQPGPSNSGKNQRSRSCSCISCIERESLQDSGAESDRPLRTA